MILARYQANKNSEKFGGFFPLTRKLFGELLCESRLYHCRFW